MHLALARKYRPQDFTQLVGQEAIVRTLTNAIQADRIHHAYLFSGVRGIGKTSLARILAKSINCETGPTIVPCQTCSACVSITQGNSLDVIEIDGASNNLVEDVRDLREQVKFLPATGKYKIIIIDEVHMLSNSAFNALLKTLEEPPPHVIFIFATTESHKIPLTILSRCQKYDFKKVNTSVLREHVLKLAASENITISGDAAHLITQCAQGSVRDAVSLLDQVVSFKTNNIQEQDVRDVLGLGDRVLIQDMFAELLRSDLKSCLQNLYTVDERGIDLKLFAEGLLACYRHLILLETTGQVPQDLSQTEADYYLSLKGILDVSLLLAQYQVLFNAIQELAYAEFPKTCFEMTLVKLSQIKDMIALSELVSQIKNRQVGTATTRQVAPMPKPVVSASDTQTRSSVTAQSNAAAPKASNWYELVKWITSEKPPLGTLLKDVVPVEFSDARIEVAVSETSQVKAILEDRTVDIQNLLENHFGKKMLFKITNLDAEKKKSLV